MFPRRRGTDENESAHLHGELGHLDGQCDDHCLSDSTEAGTQSDSSLVFQATGIGQTVTVGVSQTISDGDQTHT